MDLLKKFKEDPKKRVEGVAVTIDKDGTKIIVAREGNPKYTAALQELMSARMKEMKTTVLDTEEFDLHVLKRAYASKILLGWSGVTENGVEVPYSVEKGYQYLVECPEFFAIVQREAGRLDNFLAEQDNSLEKN